MVIYIFANNLDITERYIETLNIDYTNDIIVLFNYINVPYDILKQCKTKYIFVRLVYDSNTLIPSSEDTNIEIDIEYLGGNQLIYKQQDFTSIICIDDKQNKFSSFSLKVNKATNCLLLESEEMLKIYNIHYTENKSPSSGFVAILYMKYYFPNSKIFIVGFTGRYPDGTIPGEECHHDYKFEFEYYNQNALVFTKQLDFLNVD